MSDSIEIFNGTGRVVTDSKGFTHTEWKPGCEPVRIPLRLKHNRDGNNPTTSTTAKSK